MNEIKVTLRSSDGYSKTRRFKSIKGAQKFAQDYVGENPEIGCGYAISADGVCRITVSDATLSQIFPEPPKPLTVENARKAASDGKWAILETVPRYDGRDAIVGHTTYVHGIYDDRKAFNKAWGKIEAENSKCGAYEGAFYLEPQEPIKEAEVVNDEDIPF